MARTAKQATASQSEQDARSKGVLFCPNCSHQSQYDGDWTVVKSGQTSHYRCPDCRTEITSRSRVKQSCSPFDNYDPWQMWETNTRLLQKIFWI
jgi:predicted RNA-binding Zn-ribbon protein involved in translation (DUF1610 family)